MKENSFVLFLQTRLQAGKGYKNTFDCVVTIYKKENVRLYYTDYLYK